MGCAPSSQHPKPTQTSLKLSEFPNLLNTTRETTASSASRSATRESHVAKRRCSSAILGVLDEELGQLNAEETKDIMLGVAAEADEIDLGMEPMIALVAHDNMKPLMASFAKSYSTLLRDFRLTGTGTTCKLLKTIGLEPEERNVPSGPLGGDQVLGSMICEGEIRALFFFQDPLSSHAHVDDIHALSRLCNVYQIYFATNYRTAGAILEQLHSNVTNKNASIRVEDGMSTDIGKILTQKYLATRAEAVAAATRQQVLAAANGETLAV